MPWLKLCVSRLKPTEFWTQQSSDFAESKCEICNFVKKKWHNAIFVDISRFFFIFLDY